MPISFFRRVSRFEVFQDAWRSNKESLVYAGMLPCLATSWPQIMQIRISFRSRSDLVLDADHALDFCYPVAFYKRVSRLALQAKVAHLCFCLVRIKMLLLTCFFRSAEVPPEEDGKNHRKPLTRNYYENNSLRNFFVIFEGFWALQISRKERLFQGITREIRNFCNITYFKIILRK